MGSSKGRGEAGCFPFVLGLLTDCSCLPPSLGSPSLPACRSDHVKQLLQTLERHVVWHLTPLVKVGDQPE